MKRIKNKICKMVSMRSAIFLVLFPCAILLAGNVSAQDRKELNTSNMSRAIEAYSNGDAAEMRKFLDAEIKSNPKNGYAYSWLALVCCYYDEYGYAVSASDKALQFIPKRDKEYVVFAYTTRARAYVSLGENGKALSDFNAAIKTDPSIASLYQNRGDFYYETGEYDLADRDYRKYISLEPSDPLGYMGLGRNEKQRGNFGEAVKWFDKALQLRGSDYSKGYSFRAECYIRIGRFDEAAADIVTALSIDQDDKAYYHMQELADSSYRTIVGSLKVQAENEPNNSSWYYYLGVVSEHVKKYAKAIEYYTSGVKIDGNDAFYGRMAACYSEMGMYDKALQCINVAIEKDSDYLDYRTTRFLINYELDNIPDVISDLDYCISKSSRDRYWYYYRRGWYKELSGDTEGAMEDYTSGITLNPNYAYTYMMRGQLLLTEGDTMAARKDFRKCISIDTADMASMECAFYAYHFLGDNVSAKRLMDISLAHGGSLYDAACLYARMGEKKKAIDYLEQAFENGFRRFNHLNRDDDMDGIRNETEYKKLVAKYKAVWMNEMESNEAMPVDMVERTFEIPFFRKSGVAEVKCTVNGLPLSFVFDTGAGDVTISSVEAAFMFKNGYLSDRDVIGRSSYRTASGDIIEGTVINLEKIEFGEMTLKNVRASVVRGQSAPLLLGQSALNRLGKIEIDNENYKLKVTYMGLDNPKNKRSWELMEKSTESSIRRR